MLFAGRSEATLVKAVDCFVANGAPTYDMSLLLGRSAFSARSPEAIPDLRMRLLRAIALAMTVDAAALPPAAWGTRNDCPSTSVSPLSLPSCSRASCLLQ
jgi:hypothetical protein